MAERLSFRQFSELAELHRRLIGQVDQRVGREKAVLRKYIAALDARLQEQPEKIEFFVRWRKETGSTPKQRDTT